MHSLFKQALARSGEWSYNSVIIYISLILNPLLFLMVTKKTYTHTHRLALTCTNESRVAGINIPVSLATCALEGSHCVGTVSLRRALMENGLHTLIYV